MKKIVFLYIVILLGISGCNDRLEQYPPNQISTPTFWKTASDAQLGLNSCYKISQEIGYGYWYFDGATDNAYSQYSWESAATNISAGNITAAGVNGIDNYNAGYTYNTINLCNLFLDNIDHVQMDEATKQKYIGEVRFLRAFRYFLMAYQFGDAPMITTSNTADLLANQLSPMKESDIIAFVLAELDAAAQALPVTPEDASHASKGAALALKARIELYYGNYADAVKDAQAVMNLNKYSLFRLSSLSATDVLDNYSRFVTFSNDQDSVNFYLGLRSYQEQYYKSFEAANPELIFAAMYTANIKYQYGDFTNGTNTLNLPSELNGWSSLTPTQSMVDAYWNRDGSVHTPLNNAVRAALYNYPNTPNPAYFDDFKNRDPRFYASIFFTRNEWNAYQDGYSFVWGKGGSNNSQTGYNYRKLVDPAYASLPEFLGGQSFPLLRYAEVLLTYAEAKNELSGPDQTIYNALNQIRDRASMPRVNQTAYSSQTALRELIRNERRIELAEEGQRYFDIRRWNIAPQVMTSIYDPTNSLAQAREWQSKFMKLPYPQAAVDRNPNLQTAQSAKGY